MRNRKKKIIVSIYCIKDYFISSFYTTDKFEEKLKTNSFLLPTSRQMKELEIFTEPFQNFFQKFAHGAKIQKYKKEREIICLPLKPFTNTTL